MDAISEGAVPGVSRRGGGRGRLGDVVTTKLGTVRPERASRAAMAEVEMAAAGPSVPAEAGGRGASSEGVVPGVSRRDGGRGRLGDVVAT